MNIDITTENEDKWWLLGYSTMFLGIGLFSYGVKHTFFDMMVNKSSAMWGIFLILIGANVLGYCAGKTGDSQ